MTDDEKNVLKKLVKSLKDEAAKNRRLTMSSLFDNLKEGLEEAIFYRNYHHISPLSIDRISE